MVANLITNTAVPVSNGVFTVILDFGNVFNGASYWLEIGVCTNSGTNGFTALIPRQNVTPSPYSIYSQAAGSVAGVLSAANLPTNVALLNGNANFTGTITASGFAGNASGLTGLNAANLTGTVSFANGGLGVGFTNLIPLGATYTSNATLTALLGHPTWGYVLPSLTVGSNYIVSIPNNGNDAEIYDVNGKGVYGPASPGIGSFTSTNATPGFYIMMANNPVNAPVLTTLSYSNAVSLPVGFSAPTISASSFSGNGSQLTNLDFSIFGTSMPPGNGLDVVNGSSDVKTYGSPVPIRCFNSFLGYGSAFTDAQLLAVANNFKGAGLAAVGFTNLVADAGWAMPAGTSGILTNDPTKFSNNIPTIVSILKSNGFNLGLWITMRDDNDPAAGANQMGYGGPEGTNIALVYSNAQMLASAGVNFLKIDGIDEFPWISHAEIFKQVFLNNNAPLILNAGENQTIGPLQVMTLNSIRTVTDNTDWPHFYGGVDMLMPKLNQLIATRTWPDLDAVAAATPDGNSYSSGMLYQSIANRCQIAHVALLPAQFTIRDGNFSANFPGQAYFYTNADILAIQGDYPISPGFMVSSSGSSTPNGVGSQAYTNGTMVIARQLSDGSVAIGLVNRTYLESSNITVNLASCGVPDGISTIRDVFGECFIGYATNGSLTYSVLPNDCKFIRVYPRKINPFPSDTNWIANYEYNKFTATNNIIGNNIQAYYEWQFSVGSPNPLFGGFTPAIGGVAYTNVVQFNPNGGGNWWLGGNGATMGLTVGLDNIIGMNGSEGKTTNIVTITGDGATLWTGIFTTNSPGPTNLAFNVAGVQNIGVSVTESNSSLSGTERVFQDFCNWYVTRNEAIATPTANIGTATIGNGAVTQSTTVGNFSTSNLTNTQPYDVMAVFYISSGSVTNFLANGTPWFTNTASATGVMTIPLAPGDYIHASATMTGASRVFP